MPGFEGLGGLPGMDGMGMGRAAVQPLPVPMIKPSIVYIEKDGLMDDLVGQSQGKLTKGWLYIESISCVRAFFEKVPVQTRNTHGDVLIPRDNINMILIDAKGNENTVEGREGLFKGTVTADVEYNNKETLIIDIVFVANEKSPKYSDFAAGKGCESLLKGAVRDFIYNGLC